MNVLINAKGNVMKRKVFNVFVVLLILVFGMQTFMAAGRLSPQEVYDKYKDSLSTQKAMQLDNWVAAMQFDMYQEFYDGFVPVHWGMGK